jgi:hypothetical protein
LNGLLETVEGFEPFAPGFEVDVLEEAHLLEEFEWTDAATAFKNSFGGLNDTFVKLCFAHEKCDANFARVLQAADAEGIEDRKYFQKVEARNLNLKCKVGLRREPLLANMWRMSFTYSNGVMDSGALVSYINLKLTLLGFQPVATEGDAPFSDLVSTLVAQYREKERLLASHLCPADQRIQTFLYDYLQEAPVARLPGRTLTLDRPGMARALSLPLNRDEFHSSILSSYRVRQGALHNPKSDRRTTHGIFHVTEGGLPVPGDKVGVPKETFARMLGEALNPPADLLQLPFTAGHPNPAG